MRKSGGDRTKHKDAIEEEDLAKMVFDIGTPQGLQDKAIFDVIY